MTLSILDIKKQGLIYIVATLLCILFAMIYEFFSHDVYSNFMIYAFCIPLIFGVVVYYALYLLKIKKIPSKFESNLYNAGIATLTFGSIMQGILEIYGTTNSKIYVYPIVGTIFVLTSVILFITRTKY